MYALGLRSFVLVLVGLLATHSIASAQGTIVFGSPINGTNTLPPVQTNLIIWPWQLITTNYSAEITNLTPRPPIIGPIFPRPIQQGDWDQRFDLPPGVNGEVLCTATIGSEIYFGGRFDRVGALVSGGLLRWDGTEWSIVGEGIEGEVHALAAAGNSLYVGGSFRTLGDVSATNIARWTRRGWQSLGGGIAHTNSLGGGQYVSAILARGRDVYVGGNFHTAGGVSANNVAKWDGRQWSALGDGIGVASVEESTASEVHALEWYRDSLYAGGRFSSAGLNAASNLARWDGRQWFASDAVGGPVFTLARQGTDLLVGGNFPQIGNLPIANLARWNGRGWSAVGGGVHGAEIRGLLVHGARVYVAGSFERAGTVESVNVACWNGRRWTSLTSGVRGFASALGLRRGRLYVGGYFGLAGGVPAAFVARWHQDTWSAVFLPENEVELQHGNPAFWPPPTNAVIGEVMAVAAQGSNAYVGGRIFSAGLVPVNNLAHWNGTHWSNLGGGITNGIVTSIAVDGANVYVGGVFVLPAIGAYNLAHWNGTEWRPLHNPGPSSNIITQPIPMDIESLAAGHGKLWASGRMTIGLQPPSGYTAEWDGTNWSLILTERGYLSTATAMVADATNFFGAFDPHRRSIRHRTYSDLIRWDGTEWSVMTSGPLTGAVHAITLQHSNLFLAGKDIQIEFLPGASDLLRWDGNTWSAIDFAAGDAELITGMAASRDWLYVAGTFSPSGSPMRSVARWNGYSWSSLTVGMGRGNLPTHLDVIHTAAGDGMAYFAGNIREAGGRPAFNFEVWNESITWPSYWPYPSPSRPRQPLPHPTTD